MDNHIKDKTNMLLDYEILKLIPWPNLYIFLNKVIFYLPKEPITQRIG
jgi:hypothetical protein